MLLNSYLVPTESNLISITLNNSLLHLRLSSPFPATPETLEEAHLFRDQSPEMSRVLLITASENLADCAVDGSA
jgi:hypothetical protein